jgi:hypothetical protein
MIAAARELSIHAYGGAYRADCLCLFEENTADFFAPGERAEYAAFLDSAADSYFIMQVPVEGTIAAGGYDMTAQPGSGAPAWGIVARSWQRRGIGRKLRRLRLARLRAAGAQSVRVRASQLSRGFLRTP